MPLGTINTTESLAIGCMSACSLQTADCRFGQACTQVPDKDYMVRLQHYYVSMLIPAGAGCNHSPHHTTD